jgi:hypothetical protein
MAVVVYMELNKEFLAHIKRVTCKSHIVRRVSGGTHIRPSPHRQGPTKLTAEIHHEGKTRELT